MSTKQKRPEALTAAETKLFQAEAIAAEAKAALDKSETRLNTVIGDIRTFELARTKEKAAFEAAVDFDHGHFVFAGGIDDHSVGHFSTLLRTYHRVHPGKPVLIELNSGGGSIVAGFQLFDELALLKAQGHHLTIRVRGMAASMAGVLLQAADVREAGSNAFIMLHRAAFGAIGKAYEIEDELDFVKKLEGRIVSIFAERSGKKRQVYQDFFAKRKDLWFSAEEALAAGLVDAIK